MPYPPAGIEYGTAVSGTPVALVQQPVFYRWIRAPRLPLGSGGLVQDGLDGIELEFGAMTLDDFGDGPDSIVQQWVAAKNNGTITQLRYWDSDLQAVVVRRCNAAPPEEEAEGQIIRRVTWRFINLGLPEL